MRFIVTEKGQILRMQMKEEQRLLSKVSGINVHAPDERVLTNRDGGSLTATNNRNRIFGNWGQKRFNTSSKRNSSQEPIQRQEIYELPINLMHQIDEISSLKAQKENKGEQSNLINSNFDNHNASRLRKSSIESPSHWRYYSRKEERKQGFLNTLKVGPFIAGNTHSGFGNTVGISWNKKKQQKNILNKIEMDEEELYKTMRKITFNNEEVISSQQVVGRQQEQEQERIKILK